MENKYSVDIKTKITTIEIRDTKSKKIDYCYLDQGYDCLVLRSHYKIKYLMVHRANGRVYFSEPRGAGIKTRYLHRLIMGEYDTDMWSVVFLDRNPLNLRRDNLILMHKWEVPKYQYSEHIGVFWHKSESKWGVQYADRDTGIMLCGGFYSNLTRAINRYNSLTREED